MVSKNRQGQSPLFTIDKERSIGITVGINMRVAAATLQTQRKPYFFLDTNCGSGWNVDIGVHGSPAVFNRIADELLLPRGIERYAVCCDHDAMATAELERRMEEGGWDHSTEVLTCDNENSVRYFATLIPQHDDPRYAMGAVLFDPNGYWNKNGKGVGPPVATLPEFTQRFRRIDIIGNINTIARKRMLGAGLDAIPPIEVLQLFHKQFWLVKLARYQRKEFLLVIGRNYPIRHCEKYGFYDLNSEDGREIMRRATELKKSDEGDLDLFGAQA